jgi:hypothetical protein
MRCAFLVAPLLVVAMAVDLMGETKADPLFGSMAIWADLRDKKMMEHLKITKEQEKALKPLLDKGYKAMMTDIDSERKVTGPDKEARIRAQATKTSDAFFKSLSPTLTDGQISRLKQIMRQERGITLFDYPEIRDALKLGDKDVEALKDAHKKLRDDVSREIIAKKLTGKAARVYFRPMEFSVPDKIIALLKDDQQKTLKAMLGELYPFNDN